MTEAAAREAWFDETWTKVHPLSPLVRGWVTIVAIPAAFFAYNWEMWSNLWTAWRTGELVENVQSNPLPYLIGGGVFLTLALLIFVGFTLSWWFTRYKITEEHVMVKSGIFVRQHRKARIDRVQAVDLRQPLLARIARLAELRFEVAEGDGTAATLAFLRKREAERLRTEIMDRAAGRLPALGSTQDTAPPAAPSDSASLNVGNSDNSAVISDIPRHSAAQPTELPGPVESPIPASVPDRQIARVPIWRLIASMICGPGGVIVVLVAGIYVTYLGLTTAIVWFSGEQDASMVMEVGLQPAVGIPILIGAVLGFWGQLTGGWNFTATMTQAGLRLKYGLTTTNTQTVPPGRVQGIQIQQGLLWRPFGWYKVIVTVAGYGLDSRTTLLPVGTAGDVMRLTAEMFPDLRVERPEQIFMEGLQGSGSSRGFTEVPARAALFDPLVRRRRGFFTTASALLIRDGWMTRRLTMVPHERIQSTALQQGPLARWRNVATLHIHLPAGPITALAKNQDLERIRHLFEQETGYAAVARRLTDRNQWMLPEELAEFEKNVAEAVEKLDDAAVPSSAP
jgi:putative membrane protein